MKTLNSLLADCHLARDHRWQGQNRGDSNRFAEVFRFDERTMRLRFGLHAGVDYVWSPNSAPTWRMFDARTYLDFGTKREVDQYNDFLDFGGQIGTRIVF